MAAATSTFFGTTLPTKQSAQLGNAGALDILQDSDLALIV
jgi:hypothetical protein